MGERDAARVDTAVLLDVAGQYDAVADGLAAAVRTHLSRSSFGGAVAGRAHVAAGEALRHAVDDLDRELLTWSRSDAEIASAVRTSTDSYRAAELRGETRLV